MLMKKLISLFLTLLLGCLTSYSRTITVTLDYGAWLSSKISDKVKYEIDSLVIKGYFMDGDYATLRDYINNGKLRGIDMSGIENIATIPANAFATTKVNSSADAKREAADSKLITKLEYITLPTYVRNISDRAFFMTNLRCIDLPKLTKIGSEAFSGCPQLKAVRFHQVDVPHISDGHAFDNVPSDATLYVPLNAAEKYRSSADFSNFTTIEEDAALFVIKEFNLDSSSRPLEEQLSESMMKVDSIHITGYLPHSDIKALRLNACYGRLSGIDLSGCRIENDEFPEGAFISIDEPPYSPAESYLFGIAHNLRYIKFPEGMKIIGGNSFQNVRLLTLSMPSTLEIIEGYAFQDAEIGGDLVIPEGVLHIEREAFSNAKIAGDVYLPSTLEYIDDKGLGIATGNDMRHSGKKFYYNRMTPAKVKITSMHYYPLGDLDPIKSTDWTHYVPVGAKSAFDADERWGKFPNVVETDKLDGGVTGISSAVTDNIPSADTRVFTIDGRLVGTDINALPKGMYIVGGKKVVK